VSGEGGRWYGAIEHRRDACPHVQDCPEGGSSDLEARRGWCSEDLARQCRCAGRYRAPADIVRVDLDCGPPCVDSQRDDPVSTFAQPTGDQRTSGRSTVGARRRDRLSACGERSRCRGRTCPFSSRVPAGTGWGDPSFRGLGSQHRERALADTETAGRCWHGS
jgi:hypothetical protein